MWKKENEENKKNENKQIYLLIQFFFSDYNYFILILNHYIVGLNTIKKILYIHKFYLKFEFNEY